ncbi:MAG: hypothetical protein ACKO37_06130 [Vampirovibrionales bacterium]
MTPTKTAKFQAYLTDTTTVPLSNGQTASRYLSEPSTPKSANPREQSLGKERLWERLQRLTWVWQGWTFRLRQLQHTFTRQFYPEALAQRQERRRFAGQLLQLVLHERIPARIALCNWPMVKRLGLWMEEDSTLEAVYHALWHFDADTERHEAEPMYLDIQLELLHFMAQRLEAGEALPSTMIEPYHQLRDPFTQRCYPVRRAVWYHTPSSALYGWLLRWAVGQFQTLRGLIKKGSP